MVSQVLSNHLRILLIVLRISYSYGLELKSTTRNRLQLLSHAHQLWTRCHLHFSHYLSSISLNGPLRNV